MKSGGEIEERGAHTNIMIYVGQRYPAEYYWEGKYSDLDQVRGHQDPDTPPMVYVTYT